MGSAIRGASHSMGDRGHVDGRRRPERLGGGRPRPAGRQLRMERDGGIALLPLRLVQRRCFRTAHRGVWPRHGMLHHRRLRLPRTTPARTTGRLPVRGLLLRPYLGTAVRRRTRHGAGATGARLRSRSHRSGRTRLERSTCWDSTAASTRSPGRLARCRSPHRHSRQPTRKHRPPRQRLLQPPPALPYPRRRARPLRTQRRRQERKRTSPQCHQTESRGLSWQR